eukprot:1184714-Prorocentrum_minimum.AAC.3
MEEEIAVEEQKRKAEEGEQKGEGEGEDKPKSAPSAPPEPLNYMRIVNGLLAGLISANAGGSRMEPWAGTLVGVSELIRGRRLRAAGANYAPTGQS